jgi:hypothetical protein
MHSYPLLVAQDADYAICISQENLPDHGELLNFFYDAEAEYFLQELSSDPGNLETMGIVLMDATPWIQANAISPSDLFQLLADELVSGHVLLVRHVPVYEGMGVLQEAPEPEPPPPPPASETSTETTRCSAESITIKCGHFSKRNYQLKIEKDVRPETDTIKIVSGSKINKADEMEIEIEGTCEEGHGGCIESSGDSENLDRPNTGLYCPSIEVRGSGVTVEQPGPLKVKLPSRKGTYPSEDFVDFFKKMIVPNKFTPETYHVKVKVCGKTENIKAKIEAVPKAGWSGSVSMGYSHSTHKDSNFNQNQGYKNLKKQGKWTLSGDIKAFYNENEWKLGASGKQDADGNVITKGLFDGAQKVLDTICPLFGEIKSTYGDITLKWPKLSIGGGMEAIENKEDPQIGWKGNIKVGFSPLLGATFKVDILNILISMAGNLAGGPALAKVLIKMREYAAAPIKDSSYTGVAATIGIDFSVGTTISGGLEWTTEDGKKWDVDGKVDNKIEIKIEGYASAEIKAFIVSAGAGASMGAKSAFGVELKAESKDDQPSAYGKLYFSGITLYYTYYYEVSRSGTTNSRRGAPPPIDAKVNLQEKHENKFVWVKPSSVRWPDSSAKLAL